MIDELKLYELKHKLYQLDDNIDDDLILNVLNNKNYQNKDQLDVLSIIMFSKSNVDTLTNDEILSKCQKIIEKVISVSGNDTYTESDISILCIFYFLNLTSIPDDPEERTEQIDILEKIILDDIAPLSWGMRFVNESLRLHLLALYQYTGDTYPIYSDKISTHLQLAKERVSLRQSAFEQFLK